MANSSTQDKIVASAGGVAAWSIRHPIGVIMLTLAVVILGLFSLGRLSVDLLPNIIYPEVRVRVNSPGVPAKIMEDKITRQLEEQLAITEDVISIESSSSEGRSRVNMTFQYGKDIDIALRDASTRLDRAKRFLPTDIDAPIIYKRDPAQRPVIEYVISSRSRDSIKLRDWVDDVFAKWFINLPGIASAEVGGGLVREIQVLPDQQRMAGLGLSTDDLVDAIKKANQEEPVGRIKLERRELTGRISARIKSVEELANLPIPLPNGQYIYLKDIALVLDTHEDEKLRVRLNGISGIKVSIQKQPNANSIAVVNTIKNRLAELHRQNVIPEDIQVNVVGDQSVYVRNSLNSAAMAAGSGALLAMLVVYLFLGDIRRTLIIGSAIPIAITVTFLIMDLGGLSLNIMTLGGLAVGVGMLVDSTIVMLENIYRHQTEGEDSFEAGTHAAREVNSAIVASTSTNLAAIIPFLFVGGLVGLFFRELIFTISAAIVAAMVVALTLVPALATRLKQRPGQNKGAITDRFISPLQAGYAKSVRFVIQSTGAKAVLFSTLLLSLAASIQPFLSDNKDFLPTIDDGRIGIRLYADPGVKLDITDEAAHKVENLIHTMPDVKTVFTIAGGFIFGRTEVEARHYARIDIQLASRGKRKLDSDKWLKLFRKKLAKNRIPGVRVWAMKLGIPGTHFHRGSEDVSLRVTGQDIDTLSVIGDDIADRLRKIKGLQNISHSYDEVGQELSITIDRERAINLGFRTEQISRILKTAINGVIVTDYLEGDRSYNIRLRLPDIDTSSLSSLESLFLGRASNSQSSVYLGDVARIELIQTHANIVRDNQQRIIEIVATFAEGYSSGTVTRQIEQSLRGIHLPEGYRLYNAGISKTLENSQHTITQLLVMALFLVLVVMAVQYESLTNPILILLSIPFATIGVAIAIYLAKLPLTMPLWLGMIMLAGIVVNNAIVMVEYIEILRKQGNSLENAIVGAARLRLRPILMTTLTTVIGLTPLAIGIGDGAEMLQPLAITITSGLGFSLLVTLYLIPVLYRIFHINKVAGTEALQK
ncbi:MAG TPA: efflux RND transporter permease subunit [Gammaproteobacteria bacterium]|nr:efflux RND transporter permease subunit [Gammaproteobacteria bacterium]